MRNMRKSKKENSKLLKFIREDNLDTPREISKWLVDHLGLHESTFKIQPNNTVTLAKKYEIFATGTRIEEIPVKFNDVYGNVKIVKCQLTSMKGLPTSVFGNLDLTGNRLVTLTWSPSHVDGDYLVGNNNLVDLTGMPKKINGDFNASSNSLFNMKGGPDVVLGYLLLNNNKLKSFEGFPSIISRDLVIRNNNITTLKNIHKHIKQINGYLILDTDKIKDSILGLFYIDGLKGVGGASNDNTEPKWVDIFNRVYGEKGKKGIIDCQEELIEAGLDKFAEL